MNKRRSNFFNLSNLFAGRIFPKQLLHLLFNIYLRLAYCFRLLAMTVLATLYHCDKSISVLRLTIAK